MALADLGHRRPDPRVDPLLEPGIVPALLEVVAGTRFFPEVVALRPYALDRLHRLCPGTEALVSAPDWSAWWEAKRGTFRARRALTDLAGPVRATLKFRVSGSAAGPAAGATFAASAADAPPAGGAGGRFVLLSRAAMDRVADAAAAAGLLRMPDTAVVGDAVPAVEIAIEAADRGRSVRLSEGAAIPPALAEFLALLADLRASHRWQSFWDRRVAPTFGAFVEAERPFWEGEAVAARDRDARIVRLAVGSLLDLPEADRVAALEALRGEPGLREGIRPEEATVLASLVAVGPRLSREGEGAARALASAGRTEGLSALRARADGEGDEADRAAAAMLLEEGLREVPLPVALEAAGGASSPSVRCAALRALGARPERGDEALRTAVRSGTASEDARVRAAAFRSVGMLRTDDAGTILAYAAEKDPDTAARCGALEGLGFLGGPEVVQALGRATASPDPRLRAAAVRGLAASREPEALSFLMTVLTAETDPTVREEADRAVQATGGERARQALAGVALDRRRPAEARVRAVEGLGVLGAVPSIPDLRTLLGDPDPGVADAAAFVLGWVRDGEAAARLLDALREGRSPARTLRCLELLSLETFREGRDRDEIAALYTGWFEVSRARGARGWLAEALQGRGLAPESLGEFESGANPRAAIPALLKALRDKAWPMRRAANLELERISGASFGDSDPWTPEPKWTALADAWGAWWERERGSPR
jgi:HEAT repeat protein